MVEVIVVRVGSVTDVQAIICRKAALQRNRQNEAREAERYYEEARQSYK